MWCSQDSQPAIINSWVDSLRLLCGLRCEKGGSFVEKKGDRRSRPQHPPSFTCSGPWNATEQPSNPQDSQVSDANLSNVKQTVSTTVLGPYDIELSPSRTMKTGHRASSLAWTFWQVHSAKTMWESAWALWCVGVVGGTNRLGRLWNWTSLFQQAISRNSSSSSRCYSHIVVEI